MIISNQQVQNILKSYGVTGSRKLRYSEPVNPAMRQDRLELSPEAKHLTAIRQQVAATPDVRADLVNKLKTQIKNGTYQVDSSEVAQKMLARSLADQIISKS